MAGGSGTRFWPASRQATPKQLLPLAGGAHESLLAATVRRLAQLIPAERVYIATGAHLVEAVASALPGVPRAQILAEPAPRNTAPCIGWASATIARQDRDAVVAVLPSDHFVAREEEFRTVLARAIGAADQGHLVTVGVVPTRPETGYGYIELAGELTPGVFAAARFVEKPDRARAQAFVAGKKHLWNAGMFFFKTGVMRDAIAKHLPDLASGLTSLDEAAARNEEPSALTRIFPGFPVISIDHGVMEKADRIAVVPGDFGWSDVGSWQSAWELANKDEHGNALPAEAIAVDAANNLVYDISRGTPKKVFALVGVRDLVIVETDDAVLVIPRDRAQDVRAVVDALKSRKDDRLL
jgi:mannose-1-phosphate guanylyltransferase